MKRSVLCPMLLAAVGLIYIVLFTCAVNYIAEQVFRFTVFAKPQAVVITVALAASVLFASPLLLSAASCSNVAARNAVIISTVPANPIPSAVSFQTACFPSGGLSVFMLCSKSCSSSSSNRLKPAFSRASRFTYPRNTNMS